MMTLTAALHTSMIYLVYCYFQEEEEEVEDVDDLDLQSQLLAALDADVSSPPPTPSPTPPPTPPPEPTRVSNSHYNSLISIVRLTRLSLTIRGKLFHVNWRS